MCFFCLLCFECPHESPCPKLFQLPLVPCNFSQAYSPLPLPGVRDHSERSDCIFWLLAYLTMCSWDSWHNNECKLIWPVLFLVLFFLSQAPDRLTERFSYLVLSRTDWAGGEGLDWARLTAQVLRRPRHVHCQVCCSSGEIKRVVVTAHRHGRYVESSTSIITLPLSKLNCIHDWLYPFHRDVYRCARSSDWGDQLPIIQPEDDSSNLDWPVSAIMNERDRNTLQGHPSWCCEINCSLHRLIKNRLTSSGWG